MISSQQLICIVISHCHCAERLTDKMLRPQKLVSSSHAAFSWGHFSSHSTGNCSVTNTPVTPPNHSLQCCQKSSPMPRPTIPLRRTSYPYANKSKGYCVSCALSLIMDTYHALFLLSEILFLTGQKNSSFSQQLLDSTPSMSYSY